MHDRRDQCVETERGKICRMADGRGEPDAIVDFQDADWEFRDLVVQTLETSDFIEVEELPVGPAHEHDLYVYEV